MNFITQMANPTFLQALASDIAKGIKSLQHDFITQLQQDIAALPQWSQNYAGNLSEYLDGLDACLAWVDGLADASPEKAQIQILLSEIGQIIREQHTIFLNANLGLGTRLLDIEQRLLRLGIKKLLEFDPQTLLVANPLQVIADLNVTLNNVRIILQSSSTIYIDADALLVCLRGIALCIGQIEQKDQYTAQVVATLKSTLTDACALINMSPRYVYFQGNIGDVKADLESICRLKIFDLSILEPIYSDGNKEKKMESLLQALSDDLEVLSQHSQEVDLHALIVALNTWVRRVNDEPGLNPSQQEQVNQKLRLFAVLLLRDPLI